MSRPAFGQSQPELVAQEHERRGSCIRIRRASSTACMHRFGARRETAGASGGAHNAEVLQERRKSGRPIGRVGAVPIDYASSNVGDYVDTHRRRRVGTCLNSGCLKTTAIPGRAWFRPALQRLRDLIL